MKHHLKHMAIGGAVVLAVLLLLKVDLRTALSYALLLACPVGMVGMMFMMNKGGHGQAHGPGEDHAGHAGHEHHDATDAAPGVSHPRTRDDYERID